MSSKVTFNLSVDTLYHQISSQYSAIQRIGPIIEDIIQGKNCKSILPICPYLTFIVTQYLVRIKNKLPETVQVFENIDFISMYCQGLEKYLTGEFRDSLKEIQASSEPSKVLINCISLILNFHKTQNDFFLELSGLDRFFLSMYNKFNTYFIELIRHKIFYELDYDKHFDSCFEVYFQQYTHTIIQHFTPKMLELEEEAYSFFQTLVEEVLPEGDQDYGKNFDVSSLRKFVRFHEYIDMSKKLLKPNLSKFFARRIDSLFDTLIEKSA